MNSRPKPKRLKGVRNLVLGLLDGRLVMTVGKSSGRLELIVVLNQRSMELEAYKDSERYKNRVKRRKRVG
jgi:hypothetical protein